MISSCRPQHSREKLHHEETRAVYDVDVVHQVKHLTKPYVMCTSLIEHTVHDYYCFNMISQMTITRCQKNTSLTLCGVRVVVSLSSLHAAMCYAAATEARAAPEVLYRARTYVHPFSENSVWLMLVKQT